MPTHAYNDDGPTAFGAIQDPVSAPDSYGGPAGYDDFVGHASEPESARASAGASASHKAFAST